MSSPDKRTLAANLLLERVELKRDIAQRIRRNNQ